MPRSALVGTCLYFQKHTEPARHLRAPTGSRLRTRSAAQTLGCEAFPACHPCRSVSCAARPTAPRRAQRRPIQSRWPWGLTGADPFDSELMQLGPNPARRNMPAHAQTPGRRLPLNDAPARGTTCISQEALSFARQRLRRPWREPRRFYRVALFMSPTGSSRSLASMPSATWARGTSWHASITALKKT